MDKIKKIMNGITESFSQFFHP